MVRVNSVGLLSAGVVGVTGEGVSLNGVGVPVAGAGLRLLQPEVTISSITTSKIDRFRISGDYSTRNPTNGYVLKFACYAVF
jgi:hypothetical protein